MGLRFVLAPVNPFLCGGSTKLSIPKRKKREMRARFPDQEVQSAVKGEQEQKVQSKSFGPRYEVNQINQSQWHLITTLLS